MHRLVVLAALVCALPAAAAPAAEIHVPQNVPTLQLAIAQAQPGDTIVLDAGTYPGGNVVPAGKYDITIAGVDRNAVVLDGADRRRNGILVHADGVSILNMSAHNFLENAFYWNGADRYRASYLTAWNVRGYGIYIEDGEDGVIDHSYVSGAADAAYYIGDDRERRRRAVSGRLFRDELHRRADPRFGLARERGRHRAQHVRERGAAAGGADDDRPECRHAQRTRARPDSHRARRVRRHRHRGRRRLRERCPRQPRDGQ